MHLLRGMLIATVMLVVASRARATTYYVSAAGSDANAGTSEASPWQTLTPVNDAMLAAGDQVLFRRGDTFSGTLSPRTSGAAGNPIRFDAYGSGDAPMISALAELSAWTSVGSNLWEATLPVTREALMVVVVDGHTQQIGRYPRATAPNGGYLTFEGHTGATRVSDTDLATVPNFVGGQIVLRVNHWVLDRSLVTAQTASTVDFETPINTGAYPLENGYGYFFQNHVATLTERGDWAYDASRNVVIMFSETSPTNVRASILDSALSVVSRHDLTFSNLALVGGSTHTVHLDTVTNIGITDCEIAFSGTHGVYAGAGTNINFERNHVHDNLDNGAWFVRSVASGIVVRSNLFEDNGIRAGMGDATLALTHTALVVNIGHDATIEYNTVRNTGYTGISFDGDDITVKNNVVDRFCFVKDDGAGIYSWHGIEPLTLSSGRVVTGNFVFNGITAPAGTAEGVAGGSASGIYLDLYAGGVEVTGNTVYNVPFGRGIIMNNSRNVTITGNTLFGAETGISISHWLLVGSPVSDGLDIHDNVIFPTDAARKTLQYIDWGLDQPTTQTLEQRLHGLGVINSNFYGALNVTPFYSSYYPVSTGSPVALDQMTLGGWTLLSGFDASSQTIPALPTYVINTEVAANLVSNGTFDTTTTGAGIYSGNGAATIDSDNTSKLTGTGSLRLDVSASAPRIRSLLTFSIGAVDETKQYVVRFSTLGTLTSGNAAVYIRRGGEPRETITETATVSFGTTRVDHEVLLEHPTTVPNATLTFSIPESIGTLYFDDIEVHEVTATTRDPLETVYFVTNPTNAPVTRSFEGTAVDARGVSHTGSVELAPFSSIVLTGDTVSQGHDVIDGGTSDAGFPLPDMGTLPDGGVIPGVDGGSAVPPEPPALTSTCGCDTTASTPRSVLFSLFVAAAVVCGARRRRRRAVA